MRANRLVAESTPNCGLWVELFMQPDNRLAVSNINIGRICLGHKTSELRKRNVSHLNLTVRAARNEVGEVPEGFRGSIKSLSCIEPLASEDVEPVNVPVERGLLVDVRVTQPGATRLAIMLIGEGTHTWEYNASLPSPSEGSGHEI